MNELTKFKELGISPFILDALAQKGFEEPSSVQIKVIPLLLQEERDLIVQAQTGTGKTAAFGIPLVERIEAGGQKPQALILTPTRELAIQVAEEINSLKGSKKLRILPVYGGQAIVQQLQRLKEGLDIIVGTPGRILDHINRKSLKLGNLRYLILDEADEMLNMGFIEDVEAIINSCNTGKRVLLFSATIPGRIQDLAQKYMENSITIRIKKEQPVTDLTEQIYFEVSEGDKFEALCRIIDVEQKFYALIFCRTKVDVDQITNKLQDRGYNAEALHGDLSQYIRERIIEKFKTKRVNILVATDVAARGIDIEKLSHVINYSLPQNPDSYVHRIGRTGRAGETGTAVTFVTPAEYRMLNFIKRVAKTEIHKKQIPGVSDIIEIKKERILSDLRQILQSGGYEDFLPMAGDLLSGSSGADAVAALLKYSFEDSLSEKNYSQIREVSIDTKGKTRLFIAKGRNEGMSKKAIVDFIISKSGVQARKIDDVQVYDQFSFITVPFVEAEMILKVFKTKRGSKKPLVMPAKPEEGQPGTRRSRKYSKQKTRKPAGGH